MFIKVTILSSSLQNWFLNPQNLPSDLPTSTVTGEGNMTLKTNFKEQVLAFIHYVVSGSRISQTHQGTSGSERGHW